MNTADHLPDHDICAICDQRAGASAFDRFELAAFVEQEMKRRPESWAYVQSLQRACVLEAPATPEGALDAEAMFA